jgi:hypothetical protein
MDGCEVDAVIEAWAAMERASRSGTNPAGWVSVFCGPDKKRSGDIREGLAEVLEIESCRGVDVAATFEKRRSTWTAGEDSTTDRALAREVFGKRDVTSKLVWHFQNLRAIESERNEQVSSSIRSRRLTCADLHP